MSWPRPSLPLNNSSGHPADWLLTTGRGLPLGARVASRRRPERRGAREDAFEVFVEALAKYVAAFGDADAPQKFVAPGDWPKRVRGYPLGKRVADVRSRGRYVGGDDPSSEQLARRRRLDELGFRWTKRKGRRRVAK